MDFLTKFFEFAQKVAVEEGLLVEEDGIILSHGTINLVKEIEASQLQLVIDKALDERDEATFRKLVVQCK